MRPTVILLAILILTFRPASSPGQVGAEATASEIESLEERIKELDAAGKSDEAAGYRTLLDLRKKIETSKSAAAGFGERLESVPDDLAKVQEELSVMTTGVGLPENVDGEVLTAESLAEASRQAKADHATAKANQEKLEGEAERREGRLSMIPDQIVQARVELADSEDVLESGDLAEEGPGRLISLAKIEFLEESIRLLEVEQSYYRGARGLLVAESDLAARQSELLGTAAVAAERRLDAWREKMAKQATAQAIESAENLELAPQLAIIAEENAKIAKLRSGSDGLAGKIAQANLKLAEVKAQLALIDQNHSEAEQQVQLFESAGLKLGEAVGEILINERVQLPRVKEIQLEVRRGLKEWTTARFETAQWENRRRDEVSDLEGVVARLVATIGEEQAELARQIVSEKRDNLDDLIRDSSTYASVLGDTVVLQRSMIGKVQEYSAFIEQRILWIRSAPPLHADDFSMGPGAVRELFSAREWRAFAGELGGDLREHFLLWPMAAFVLLYLLWNRARYKRRLAEAGEVAARRNCRSYEPTIRALFYTLLLAIPIPLAIGFLHWRSVEVALMGSWVEMLCRALHAVTVPIAALAIARGVSRPDGLLQSHLGLGADRARLLFRGFTWALLLIIVSIFFREAFISLAFYPGARICFLFAMLVLAGFALTVLRPSKGLMSAEKDSLWRSTAYAVYLCILGVALSSGVAAYLGYFYTVLELAWRIQYSIWVTLIVLLVAAIAMRLLVMSRRRVAFEQRLASFRAYQAEQEKLAGDEADPTAPNLEEIEADLVDITKVKEQTRSVIRMAALFAIVLSLWGVWVQVAPSLKVLDGVRVWSSAASEPGASDSQGANVLAMGPGGGQDGSPGPGTLPLGEADTFVSLADLGLAMLTLFLTYFAARNLPGLLEITVLRRLRLQPGGTYTVTTLVRYVIVLVGIITAFAYIDITWSKVQWIAAAITLGIGFGLQEVFANFVAGLILLFERPIRLGDFVTVGGVNGKVTKIQIRATTIRDRSNKELLVPNKEFITGQLVNWTLTDVVIRLEVAVGIAYGSDTELAREILFKIGHGHEAVLSDPEPAVVFSSFGESSLDFELRVFVSGADDLISTGSEIRFAIDEAFRDAGIEIAFPQRDLHIRSTPAGLLPDQPVA